MNPKYLIQTMKSHHTVSKSKIKWLAYLMVFCGCLLLMVSGASPINVLYTENKRFEASTAIKQTNSIRSYDADAMWTEPSSINLTYPKFRTGFNVTVWTNVSQTNIAWQIALRFDPTILTIVNSGLTGPDGTSDFYNGYDTGTSGSLYIENGVAYFFELLDAVPTHPAGSGSLYWIEFKGAMAQTSANQTTLSLEPADSFVLNESLNEIPMSYHGTVIQIPHLPDINGDSRIDMKDIAYVARRFMCTPSDPLWDPVADINGDIIINMVDIATVARHFMEQEP